MGKYDNYFLGCCDICSFQVRLNTMRFNDRGSRVCMECWEPVHPQKYLRTKGGDPRPLPYARPDPNNSEEATYTCANQTIAATGGTVTFPIIKTARLDIATSVYVQTRSISAQEVRDFVRTAGTVNFIVADTTENFQVTVNNISPLSAPRVFAIDILPEQNAPIPIVTAYCVIG